MVLSTHLFSFHRGVPPQQYSAYFLRRISSLATQPGICRNLRQLVVTSFVNETFRDWSPEQEADGE